jgi:phage terminase large subunit
MKDDRSINWSELSHFFPAQNNATAIASAHRFTLYGGTRGPGKSYWLRWYLLRRLLEFGGRGLVGVRVGLFCEDYPSLKDRQVSKIATEFPAWLGSLRESKSEGLAFHLAPAYGSGILALRNLDDATKYQSAEFAIIAIDELTKNRENTFHVLRGSLRWPGVADTQFIAASNSNGLGREWVRRFWIEKDFSARPELAPIASQFCYIKASPRDNPHLAPSYWDDLNTLPEHLRRSWRDGDWFVPNLGVVYDDFSDANITMVDVDPRLPFDVAVDDGYVDPRAILFIQKQGARVLVFDEIYHTHHLPEVCVREMLERCAAHGWPRPRAATRSHEAPELAARLKRFNIPSLGGVVPVRDGIDFVRSLVLDGQGVRTLFVHRRCENFIRELIEGYHYDDRLNSEEPVDEANHACDAFKNYAWQRIRKGTPQKAAQSDRSKFGRKHEVAIPARSDEEIEGLLNG